MGVKDRFGTSASAKELLKYFELTAEDIIKIVKSQKYLHFIVYLYGYVYGISGTKYGLSEQDWSIMDPDGQFAASSNSKNMQKNSK